MPAASFNFRVFFAPSTAGRAVDSGSASTAASGAAQSLMNPNNLIGFADVSGLNGELEVEEYREGGFNTAPRRFPRWGRYPNLVLRRGVTDSTLLWDWWDEVLNRSYTLSPTKAPPRRNGIILLDDFAHQAVAGWFFLNALPERLIGPGLAARSNEIAIETLELSHEGLMRLPKANLPK